MSELPPEVESTSAPVLGLKTKWLYSGLALSWALFQLSLASWLILDSLVARAIHLSFGLFLAYLLYPARKNAPGLLWMDLFFAAASLPVALYVVWDFQGLALRMGRPSSLDLGMGLLLVALLLEATRRAVGLALPLIVLVISAYGFLGPWLPGPFSLRGVSLAKYVSQVSLSSEGIFGIPLDVSASTIFLFVLFGAILERGGAGKFFTDLALALLGRYKGGPAKAAVASSGLTGLVSGSSIANIVTTGTFTIPLMKKSGLPATKAAATEVAASTDGQLMPPIMGAAAFIIAEYVNIPYWEVVKAAFIPAFISYFALFWLTHLEAGKLGLKGLPANLLPQAKAVLKEGYLHLLPLGVLLFELMVLMHSPKLAVFRAILIALALILLKHRGRPAAFVLIAQGMIQGSRNMVSLALATAAAGIIVGVVGLGIGGMLNSLVEALSGGNLLLLLLITAIVSLILGMGLPTTATYIVMASLTAPVIVHVGAAQNWAIPLLAAHLFCFYFGILADDTPPVGLASYTAAAIAGSDPIATGWQGFLYDLRTAIIPFMFVLNPELILHGVTHWGEILLIFFFAAMAAMAFTSALHGWWLRRVNPVERIFLFAASLLLFYPQVMGFERMFGYGSGLLILGFVFTSQRRLHREKS